MPILTVNVSPQLLSEIKSFIEEGRYRNPEEFLETAAFNQAALERSATAVIRVSEPTLTGQPIRSRNNSTRPAPVRVSVPLETTDDHISVIARLAELRDLADSPKSPPALVRPADERVWGQINRLFPLKLASRWIHVANTDSDNWLGFHSISAQLVSDVAVVGSFLERADMAAQRQRDQLFATGLPKVNNMASQDRYLTQVIARSTRTSTIYPGAICQYGFATFDGDRLTLTDQGARFARLPNPVLQTNQPPIATLNDEERDFLCDHILHFVPGEFRDMTLILEIVKAGHVKPESLSHLARPSLPAEWSDLMARTHLSGLIGRMVELGLLERSWTGRNVTYACTSRATLFEGVMYKAQA